MNAYERETTRNAVHDPDFCGTYAGAQYHHRHGEPVCDPCRAAATAYMRQWRADRKAQGRPVTDGSNARKRALTILGRRYPDELEDIIRQETHATPTERTKP